MAVLALAGCGESTDYVNDPRPPAPIDVSAAISEEKVTVSPDTFGAGPITLIIANLTDDTQKVTVQTDDLSNEAGIKQTSSAINPQGTATLKVDVGQGRYTVSVDGAGIRPARMKVGRDRPSSQDQLLQP